MERTVWFWRSLGLAISRQLTKLMGGTIRTESALGKGSVFTVLISFPIASETPVVVVKPNLDMMGSEKQKHD